MVLYLIAVALRAPDIERGFLVLLWILAEIQHIFFVICVIIFPLRGFPLRVFSMNFFPLRVFSMTIFSLRIFSLRVFPLRVFPLD